MRSSGLKLGRLHGIDISIDAGVIPLLILLSVLLATSVLPQSVPGHIALTYWTVALLIAVLFVASLLVHELAHSIVAGRFGIPVKGIILWLFGGISQMESEPETPGAQFLIAVVGPLASIGFGAAALGGGWAIQAAGGPRIYVAGLQWLGIVNGALGIFNLLPGVPLDGGHVLTSIIWKIRRSRTKGAIAAAVAGRFLGIGIAAIGLYQISATGSWFGVWNIGIGLMLHQGARYQEQFLRIEDSLGDAVVKDVMDSDPKSASSMATISQAVEVALSSGHQSAVPILNWSGHIVALVELSDLYAIPKNKWQEMTALAAARADQEFVIASPNEKVAELMVRMGQLRRRHAAVVVDGNLIGLVGPEQILARSGRQAA